MRGMRPLSDDEINRVSAVLGVRDRALFFLCIRTGFRISEALSLRLKDVLNGEIISEYVLVARQNMKGKKSGRAVPLHSEARIALSAWIANMPRKYREAPETPLFPSREGGPLTRGQSWKILTDAYRKVGAFGRIGTHGCRKTFAKRVYEKLNHDLIGTQRALGHKSINSTTSYLSFADDLVNKAILED